MNTHRCRAGIFKVIHLWRWSTLLSALCILSQGAHGQTTGRQSLLVVNLNAFNKSVTYCPAKGHRLCVRQH